MKILFTILIFLSIINFTNCDNSIKYPNQGEITFDITYKMGSIINTYNIKDKYTVFKNYIEESSIVSDDSTKHITIKRYSKDLMNWIKVDLILDSNYVIKSYYIDFEIESIVDKNKVLHISINPIDDIISDKYTISNFELDKTNNTVKGKIKYIVTFKSESNDIKKLDIDVEFDSKLMKEQSFVY